MKPHAAILADARVIAEVIAQTDPDQRDALYDAVANILRVTQNVYTSTLFEALARQERGLRKS